MRRIAQFLAIYVAASLMLGGLFLLQSFPERPQSLTGWAMLFALAIPLTVVGEAVGELLFRNRLTRAVEDATRTRSFSWFRIAYVLSVALAVIAALWAIAQVLPPTWKIDEL